MGIVFLDGDFLPEEEAKISPLDRGFLVGDGVFTTLKIENGVIHFLKDHLERLKKQCLAINLKSPLIDPSWVEELVLKNKATEGLWRMKILLTRGEDYSMHLPEKEAKHLFMFLKSFKAIPYKPLSVALFPIPAATAHAKIKSLAHLNRYCIMEHAKQKGFDDAVTVTEGGFILEYAFANIFWKKGNDIFLPHPELPYYFGVTITKVTDILRNLGYVIHFTKAKINEIPEDACIYRCNTMTAIRPVIAIEERIFKRDEKFEEVMQREFESCVHALSLQCVQLDYLLT